MLKNKIDKKIKLNLKKKKHMNFRQPINLAIQVMYSSVSIDFFIPYITFHLLNLYENKTHENFLV
jgi:hypothetical protein